MITKAQITSVKLLKDRDERKKNSLFVAEGEKIFEELINSSLTVSQIFYINERISEQTRNHIIRSKMEEVYEVSAKEMDRLSHLKTPTPILITVKIENYAFKYIDKSLILALDGVQDPGNLGTIIRLADWFGIEDIICSRECADLYNPKVVQATMGALSRVRVSYVDLPKTIEELSKKGVEIYGTFLDGEVIYSKNIGGRDGVIVMGSEGRGVSKEIESMITKRLYIPPYPMDKSSGESLNVAVATAIVCSEFRRDI